MAHHYKSVKFANFGGPSREALAARNVRYFLTESGAATTNSWKIRTRAGHKLANSGIANGFDYPTAIKSMAPFKGTEPNTSDPFNRVIFLAGNEIKTYDQETDAVYDNSVPGLTTTVKLSVAKASTRAYIAGYDANGIGTDVGRVTNGFSQTDRLFQPPPLVTNIAITLSAIAGGTVTPGLHYIALVFTTRNGYTTRPGPVSASTGEYTPIGITIASNEKIRVTVTCLSPWPVEITSVAVIMTPANDPNSWYFPANASAAVTGGSSTGATIDVDVTDAALFGGPSADDYFNRLSRNAITGAGFFKPSFVAEYKDRIVYGAGDRVYVSDKNDPQSISEDEHVLLLPGLNIARGAFSGRDGNLYLESDFGTYATSDNGGKPIDWVSPASVDNKIGIPANSCLMPDLNRDVTYVANQSGLWIFKDGSFGADKIPLSFFCEDWSRINWALPYLIDIVDDVEQNTVRVLAPIDSSTVPNAEFTFNYAAGKTPTRVKFSLNSCPGRQCMTLVPVQGSGKMKVWLGPQAAGEVWEKDETLYKDMIANIADQNWESLFLFKPEDVLGSIIVFRGVEYWARGNSQLSVQGFSPEHTTLTEPKSNNLVLEARDKSIRREWEFRAENQSIQISAQFGWFEMTAIYGYYSLAGSK